MGYLADRMSVNLELPTAEGLATLAPQKTRASILTPMRRMQQRISGYRLAIGKNAFMERSTGNQYLEHSIFSETQPLDGLSDGIFTPNAPDAGDSACIRKT